VPGGRLRALQVADKLEHDSHAEKNSNLIPHINLNPPTFHSFTMSEPPERLQTRAKNSAQHPGLLIPKRKRRTKAQMVEDREREQAEKEALEENHQVKLRELASLEDDISQQDAMAASGRKTHVQVKPRPKPRPKNVREN
jgi:hypothetical protein